LTRVRGDGEQGVPTRVEPVDRLTRGKIFFEGDEITFAGGLKSDELELGRDLGRQFDRFGTRQKVEEGAGATAEGEHGGSPK